ncbi:hypothetical protein RQP46_004314 [Phenoliferia psychrophenolica]
MLYPTILAAAALVTSSLAGPGHVVVERRDAPPSQWKRSTGLRQDHVIPLRIGLRQSNLHRLDEELNMISHPSSAAYGQHWTSKEIADFFSPSAQTVDTVRDWLVASGIESYRHQLTGGNSWLTLNVTVAEAEEILDTRYEMFEHSSGVLRLIFTKAKTQDATTLACLEALYGYGGYTQKATMLNSYGIVEYTPQSFSPQDLDMFFKQYRPDLVGKRPDVHTLLAGFVVPFPTEATLNAESDLDLEYAMSVGFQGSFNNFLDGLDASYCTYEGGDDLQAGDMPYTLGGLLPGQCGALPFSAVISTSYGSDEYGSTAAYQQRQCYEYGKLGMQGTTFLYSSGDYGVAGNGGACYDKASKQTSTSGTTFNPSFPGGCPYVTSVGATQTKVGADLVNDAGNAEEACEASLTSHSICKAAVATFFSEHMPTYTAAQYNNSQATRGFPDIALNGANYPVSYAGNNGLVFGTSASAPVGGAIFALINDARYAAGKGPIGYINNAIYTEAFKDAFNDITSGGNQGCGTPGFTAVKGWDPVTGLGTPKFQKLLDLFLALP